MSILEIPPAIPVHLSDRPPLGPGEVHLWLADLAAGTGDESVLDRADRERAARFVDERGRSRFVRSRELLRRLLGGYLGAPPGDIRLETRGEGKPVLVSPPADLHFNLSHAGDLWLLAVADREVGVDVERPDRGDPPERVAERVFSPEEVKSLRKLVGPDRTIAFYRIWTIREAVTKLRGEGIFTLSANFDVLADPGRPIVVRPECGEAGSYHVGAVPLPRGHLGALATAGGPVRIRFFRLDRASPGP